MTSPLELPLHVDSTMMSCFRACPQKFYREFILGLRPPSTSIDLHAGGCFASAIENTYRGVFEFGLPIEAALPRARLLYDAQWGNVAPPDRGRYTSAKTKERVWDAVWNDNPTPENRGYFNAYYPKTDHIQPYFDTNGKPTFEYTFAVPLEPADDHDDDGQSFPLHPSGSPFLYVGRVDRLGFSNSRPVWCDEKTTGTTPGINWAEKWLLRSQFIGYTWALRRCGIPVEHGYCRGVAILKEKIHHIESPPLNYSQVLIDRWHEQLRRDMWKLRRAWDQNYWDFNLAETCTAYGSCIFLDSCQSADPDAWNINFTVRHWNPLLKNPEVVSPLTGGTP